MSRRCGRPTPGSSPLARGLQIREIEERIKRRIIPARAGFTGGEPPFDDADADHPRSRGVYSSPPPPPPPPPPPSPGTGRGSSPLARGLPQVHRLGSRDGGIIPARAGFTAEVLGPRTHQRDHPRSRGVYGGAGRWGQAPVGSSPLARGLRVMRGGGGWWTRIIPARAGFTPTVPESPGHAGDHPRSRGVYAWPPSTPTSSSGSSPLARGLPVACMVVSVFWWIIPARAGFTFRFSLFVGPHWDHPRSRGVYSPRCPHPSPSAGSSPLARGLRTPAQAGQISRWIIPARAGFTPPRPTSSSGTTDHPRSRGGLPGPGHYPHHVRRIIPARAGFTRRRTGRRPSESDHPRSRGVYGGSATTTSDDGGSSPLARGLLMLSPLEAVQRRIIPARAGFTALACSLFVWTPGSSPLARGLLVGGEHAEADVGIIPARAGFTSSRIPEGL